MNRSPTETEPILRSLPYIAPYAPAQRPTWFDFSLMLIGIGGSLVLSDWSGFKANATEATPPWLEAHFLRFLPDLLFLPVGLLILWPFFYLTQWLRGRMEAMTGGEWLWGLAWLALLPWVGWIAWQYSGFAAGNPAAGEFQTMGVARICSRRPGTRFVRNANPVDWTRSTLAAALDA